MEETPLSPLKKGEIIGGFILLPHYLLLTSILVTLFLLVPDLLRGRIPDANDYLAPVNFWSSLLNLAAVLGIFWRFLFGQFRTFRGSVGRIIGTVALGYAMVLGGNLVINALQSLFQTLGLDTGNANQEAVEALLGSDTAIIAVLAILCAPIGEECLFRGLIFGLLHRKSRFWAYAVSMAAFSMGHVFSGALMGESLSAILLSFLTYLPVGFALAWVFERTRSLWASIALHFLNNAVAIGLLLLLPTLGF